MRIETEVKLDFKVRTAAARCTKTGFQDVLIRPKRSTLRSRADVSLERSLVCKHSKQTWVGVPVAVSNMDTTGTFEMVLAGARFDILVCLHKHYSAEEIIAFAKAHANEFARNAAVSAGTSDKDFAIVKAVFDAVGDGLKMICLDVANGCASLCSRADDASPPAGTLSTLSTRSSATAPRFPA